MAWTRFGLHTIFKACPKGLDREEYIQQLYATALKIACKVEVDAPTATNISILSPPAWLARCAGGLGILYILHETHPSVRREVMVADRIDSGSPVVAESNPRGCRQGVPIRLSPAASCLLDQLYRRFASWKPQFSDFRRIYRRLWQRKPKGDIVTSSDILQQSITSAFQISAYCGPCTSRNIPSGVLPQPSVRHPSSSTASTSEPTPNSIGSARVQEPSAAAEVVDGVLDRTKLVQTLAS